MPQSARLSEGGGGGGQSLFGQCPNRPCVFFSGASLSGLTWGRVRRLVGKPQGEPAWIVWCCIPGDAMMVNMEMGTALSQLLSTLRFYEQIRADHE